MSNSNIPSLTGHTVDSYTIGPFLRQEVYGPVYVGQNQQSKQKIRIHFLKSVDGKPLSHDRFRNGLYGVKNIQSPHLNTIDGFGRFQDLFYIAYQDQNLKPIAEVIKQSSPSSQPQTFGKLPFSTVKRWIDELHQVLSVLHSNRVYHHGLSLDTLWVNESGSLVVSHQGLAVIFKKRMTSLSNSAHLDDPLLLHRSPYVAPEEIKGRLLDQNTDLYAAGILSYQFMMGKPPFLGQNPTSTLRMHLDLDWNHTPTQLPPLFNRFFDQCLGKEAKSRFGNIQSWHNKWLELSIKYEEGQTQEESNDLDEGFGIDFDDTMFGGDPGDHTFVEFSGEDATFCEDDMEDLLGEAIESLGEISLSSISTEPEEDEVMSSTSLNLSSTPSLPTPPLPSPVPSTPNKPIPKSAPVSPPSLSNPAPKPLAPQSEQIKSAPPVQSPISKPKTQSSQSSPSPSQESPISSPTQSSQPSRPSAAANYPSSNSLKQPQLVVSKTQTQVKQSKLKIVLFPLLSVLFGIGGAFALSIMGPQSHPEEMIIRSSKSRMSVKLEEKTYAKLGVEQSHTYAQNRSKKTPQNFEVSWKVKKTKVKMEGQLPVLDGVSHLYIDLPGVKKNKRTRKYSVKAHDYQIIKSTPSGAYVYQNEVLIGLTPLIYLGEQKDALNIKVVYQKQERQKSFILGQASKEHSFFFGESVQ